MLQSPICQTPALTSESVGAAGRSEIEIVFRTPIMLLQSSITILLPDGQTWRQYSTPQRICASCIVANSQMAQLVPRHLCVVVAATFFGRTSSHFQPRIWSTILERNWMMMLRRGTQIQDASWLRKSASKILNRSFKEGLSDHSEILMSSGTVVLVSLPIMSKGLLLMRMWLRFGSMITLWILPLQALWPIGSIQSVPRLQMSRCEDGMHWLDGCSRIFVVGGYISGTLVGGRMGDSLEFFGEVLGLFFVFYLFYHYIGHIHAWWALLRVHDVGIDCWDANSGERHSGSDRTPCMAIM